jgi:hypothetical protein
MSAADYVLTLLNPFDSRFPQPKILDGGETRSAGVRFRSVGNVTLTSDGSANYFVLFPGFSYCLNWKTAAGAPAMHSIHPSHLGSLTSRQDVRKVRLVSAGLKLSLENTSDDNEGNWEAIRIPIDITDFEYVDGAAQVAEDFGLKLKTAFAVTDLANHSTYQTGRLRDIHRFLFKLNSTDPDHDFCEVDKYTGVGDPAWDNTVHSANLTAQLRSLLDSAFDIVVIKITGRVDAAAPSVIRYDLVSNQEVVYKDGTALGRLMTNNVMMPSMDVIHDRTRFMLPAIQLA